MDIKVGFVGSAWERKDHPFISLWAGATMWDHLMHSEKGVPRQSLLMHPWNASSWTFPGALSCSRPLLAFLTSWWQSRLPIRAEQLWNRTAPRRPCWLQEWICLTDELPCQRWACHAWLKMISVTPVHRPWPLSDLFSNGNGFVWTLSGVGPWFPLRPGQAFERRLSELGGHRPYPKNSQLMSPNRVSLWPLPPRCPALTVGLTHSHGRRWHGVSAGSSCTTWKPKQLGSGRLTS